MSDLLLTHGYFLAGDAKEREIMRPYPPLGLLSLSAYLKRAGFSVEIYDSTFGDPNELEARLPAAGCIGIYTNLMTRRAVLDIIAMAKRAKRPVVLGGPESASYADEYLNAGADIIVIGEGETALADLLPSIATTGIHRLHDIRGIVFRDELGQTIRTAPRDRFTDLDALPFPDREAIDLQRYLAVWRQRHGRSSINLITARGCPYRCTWCSHGVYGYSHRRRSPTNVAEEVAVILERYAPDQLWYADDVFTISHPWLRAYAEELRRRNLHRPFETITRADRLQTEESARLLRELGCERIWIGSESGSQRILDAMQRGVTVEQVHRAVKLAQVNGIEVGMFLMWGYEGEKLEDIAATVDLVKYTNPDVFFTTVSYPIKGTPYFDRVKDRVETELAWAQRTDRDYTIRGRRDRSYYTLADQWLRNEVAAHRLQAQDPSEAAQLAARALQARAQMTHWDSGA